MNDDPTRVPDDEYEANQAVQVPLPPPAGLPPEDLVGQAVERAAEKVAAVTVSNGRSGMNRTEGLICVAVLVILNFAVLFVGLRTYNDIQAHKEDFGAMCEVFVNFAPPERTTELAKALAACLR